MKFRKKILILIVLFTVFACAQDKNPVNTKHTYEVVVKGLDNPWGFTFLPDKSILITENEGEIIHFKNGTKTDIKNVPEIYNRGQGGLLDIVLHPNYINNGWIYITYSSTEGEGKGGHTALMRAKLKDNALIEKQVLYKATPNTTRGQHFGSRIVFDDEGYLYFTIGERGNRDENPQAVSYTHLTLPTIYSV